MGELYGPWQRALDSNLAIVATAKLYTFDSLATTTPKTTYSDAACTVPHQNPVGANPDGSFPQIFAPDGDAYYVVLRSNTVAAGGLILNQYQNVQALGSAVAGVLARDFGLGGKWQVYGDSGAGKVRMEFGDPEPDVLGGMGVISGWGGSQLDEFQLDAAILKLTGLLTLAGHPIPGLVVTSATPFTNVASVNIPLTSPLSGIGAWDIDVWDLQHLTTSTQLKATLSFDGAATFKTGGTDYRNGVLGAYAGATAVLSGSGAAFIAITDAATVKGSTPGRLRMRIITPPASASLTSVDGNYSAYDQTATSGALWSFQTFVPTNYGTATHIQLFSSSGNITGKYRVTGLFGLT